MQNSTHSEDDNTRLEPEQRYATVAAHLRRRPGVELTVPRKRGLGSMALCVHNKIFAILSSTGQLVVRLPKPRVASMVLAGQGERFSLSHGQPMHEWVVVSRELEDRWLPLAEEALAFAIADAKE